MRRLFFSQTALVSVSAALWLLPNGSAEAQAVSCMVNGDPVGCTSSVFQYSASTSGSSSNTVSVTNNGAEELGLLAIAGGAQGTTAGAATVVNLGSITLSTTVPVAGVAADATGGAGAAGGDAGDFESAGHGGNGGAGGSGTVNNAYPIATMASASAGILVGADGGAGGSGGSASFDNSAGGGGGGGSGGGITLSNQANGPITTSGIAAPGIALLAAGGTGGTGGAADGENNAQPGGSGGSGGRINLTNFANILTQQVSSFGIEANAAGGAGGQGGQGGSISDGGTGGNAGVGGNVTLTTSGIIQTDGANSVGLFANADGGAGGQAPASGDFTASGGTGGAGGKGGTIWVTNVSGGELTTAGAAALAVMISAEGGAGGEAASAGEGGAGALGGQATIVNSGTISTVGGDATAVSVALSGGAGGAGGQAATVASAGTGGAGGAGGTATVSNDALANILTSGTGAGAIAMMVAGGEGGDGGPAAGENNAQSGGAGGAGGTVTLSNLGSIITGGDQASGIAVEAMGGVGGAGGDAGTTTDGGGGGAGGTGGTVLVSNGAELKTGGTSSLAIAVDADGGAAGVAQEGGNFTSIGGNGALGGAGGTITISNEASGSITTAGADATAITASASGGRGTAAGSGEDGQGTAGAGGAAGTIAIDNSGTIAATGTASLGVRIDAKGGVGGDGGASPYGASAGAPGGLGGAVTVVNSGSITTAGSSAAALQIDSAGGDGGVGQAQGSADGGAAGGAGGGAGGVTVTLLPGSVLQSSGATAAALSLKANGGVGGDGGLAASASGAGATGGMGGTVSATLVGLITTAGSQANAVTVEANGGKGGGSGTSPAAGAPAGDITIDAASIGQSLGIMTSGNNALGMLVQATGGTGGKGLAGDIEASSGAQGGTGGTVTVQLGSTATVTTAGVDSPAVALLSQGGAGGAGAHYLDLIGSTGNGAVGGSGAAVTVTAAGSILTQGDYSPALFAESAGGNGGDGGTTIAAINSQGGSGGVGGNDGTIGAGPIVSVSNSGTIQTLGFASTGIDAESYGGNGGAGGGANGLVIAIGGNSGAGGSGGDVGVSNTGSVSTNGDASFGILGLSVGGGAGTGGNANSLAPIADVSVGGNASGGGGGGNVTISNDGTITTNGATGFGILAESVGGGGGNGGTVNASSASVILPPISVAIGGAGGNGGVGGNTTVTNAGSIGTAGFGSTGIEALSVGGGGGTGGGASTSSYEVGFGELTAITVTTAVGGQGGTGGDAGTISLGNTGTITTDGDMASGIAAYGVGGGGGDGGNAATHSYSYGTSPQVTISVAVGGTGGAGGAGNLVTIGNSGDITTNGFAASAIYAASIGGGGGNGGTGAAVTDTELPGASAVPVSLGDSSAVTVGVGGSGGAGSTGGAVTLTNSGVINTHGNDSQGLFAQSVGGGGGIAASGQAYSTEKEQINVSVGGAGGSGATGGAVTVSNAGTGAAITTTGDGATAIEAQSVGGGGGTAGTSSAGTSDSVSEQLEDEGIENSLYASIKAALPTFAKSREIGPEFLPTSAISVAVGGAGGTGGDGGTVTVSNEAALLTNGSLADGILAQSVGGGGGTGGAAAQSGSNLITTGMSLGGRGGAGGDGEGVTITNSGIITTTGGAAFGILGQSVGGGGGLASLATTDTLLDFTISADLGGYGDAASAGGGGTISVQSTGSFSTAGAESHAIVAQSIGGGGGLERLNPNGTIASTASDSALSTLIDTELTTLGFDIGAYSAGFEHALQHATGSLSIDLGGQGSSGDGGAVTVTDDGSITTTGANAFGIIAQSIGGGGGLVASSGKFTQPTILQNATLGGGNGDGGPVSVNFGGNDVINTTGIGATAVLAQSIGGGGGYTGAINAGGVSYQAFLAGSALTNGIGGAVTVDQDGPDPRPLDLTTTGANAHGIFVQSLSGGGGVVGSAAGINIPTVQGNAARSGAIEDSTTPGDITIDLNAHISTTGEGSVGIYAQSGVQGSTGAIISPASQNGNINVVYTGTLLGGAGTAAGIQLDGGNQNTILLQTGSQVSALSNTAIVASLGQTTLNNYGTVTGSVDLNTTGQAEGAIFHNEIGGTYASVTGVSPLILAGSSGAASGVLQNDGTVIVGGKGLLGQINLLGDYVQSQTGVLAADVSALSRQTADLISVSGTANLGGTILLDAVNSFLPGEYTVVQSAGTMTTSGFSALEAAGTFLPVTWTAQQISNKLSVSPEVHFIGSGLAISANGQSLERYLQATWDAGGSAALAPLYAQLVNLSSGASYGTALNTTSSEHFGTAAVVRLADAQAGMSAVMSCPEFAGNGVDMVETDCTWGRLTGGVAAQYSSPDGLGYHAATANYRIGGEHEFLPNWYIGASAAYDTSWSVGDNGAANSLGQGFDFSGSVKHQMGNWLVGIATDIGNMWYQNSRTVQIGSATTAAASDSQALTASARIRVNYEIPFESWYIKPYADLDVIYVSVPGFSETGSSPANLAIRGGSQTTFGASPNVEVGGRLATAAGWTMRPYATVGATFLSNSDWITRASLQGAPAATGQYDTTTPLPSAFANVGLGLQLLSSHGIELRADVTTHVSPNYLSESGNLRLAYHF